MNNSLELNQDKVNLTKNNFLCFSLLSNVKRIFENAFKSCFAKNKIYVDSSTQTEDEFQYQDSFSLADNDNLFQTKNNYIEMTENPPEKKSSVSKFVEDSQFNKIIESYSLLNSSSCLPLNLNNGLLFQSIFAEGKSPWELDKPSTKVSHATTFSTPDQKLLKINRVLAL